ncbi:UvrD-helicase domain-containing protein [Gammaproteobacteria bacterium]|nr:UvrD-helicase domain-containing protein [Gammaproteobacteria bacterium]
MTKTMQPIDHEIRQQAMDPSKSAIVSAPAGSGKTYLLTRRMINLLLNCERPDHVIAITFTKKAANEMRERLIACLTDANEKNAIQLLEHANQHQWDILTQTQNLQIMTIDAFCSWLLQRSKPQHISPVSIAPKHLYQQVITDYFSIPKWCAEQKRLIKAMHGQYLQVEGLLMHLLAIRDQWQDHLMTDIQSISQDSLLALNILQEKECQNIFEQHSIIIEQVISSITQLHQYFDDETFAISDKWLFLSDILLTKTGTPRSKYTKAQGIYPKSMTEHTELDGVKKQALDLLEALKDLLNEQPAACSALFAMQLRPTPQSPEEQAFLSDLTVILRALNIRLTEAFEENDRQDFTQIAFKAVSALQNDTILQTYCKQHIHHILMDEFQDTSSIQYAMAKAIVKHWPKDSQRTVFAVGDPMQSIYRFRQADVRLFIKTQNEPLAHIQTQPLFLKCNFRSSAKIIEAINDHFTQIFPQSDQLLHAAIQYRVATPTQPSPKNAGIYLEFEENETPQAQANRAVRIIVEHQNTKPDCSIGVLAQTRSHLKHLIQALESNAITFNAIDIYPLGKLAAINDLCALLGHLYDPKDEVAWYSILRSPLSGLTLDDLYALKHQHELSEEGYFKLSRIKMVISHARKYHIDCVKQCAMIWESLFAPSLYPSHQSIAIAKWFDEVTQLRLNRLSLTHKSLIEHFERSHMSITHPNCNLHLLTTHKSKGLEYDHVIIMHCEKRSQAADVPLLYAEAAPYALIHPTFLPNSTNTEYLKQLNKKRDGYESMRLLYVAATRAKFTLHLISYPNQSGKNWISAFQLTQDARNTYKVSEFTEGSTSTQKHSPSLQYHLEAPLLPNLLHSKNINFEYQPHEMGTSLHFLLEHYDCPNRDIRFKNHLLKMGYNQTTITYIEHIKEKVLQQIQQSKIGQWIFKPRTETMREKTIDFEQQYFIIDRLFIEDSSIWIIDFKFHTEKLSDETLYQKHQAQMKKYIQAVSYLYPEYNVNAMLYMPITDQTLDISYASLN